MSNTTITALTGTAGGTNVPMDDMSADPAQIMLVTRDAAGGPYRTRLASAIPGLRTEFNFILESRADLIAAVGAPVGGIFDLVAGSYFIKTSFSLNAGEGMRVNNVSVLIMGGGAGKTLTGGAAGIPLLQVTGAAARCQLLTVGLTAAVANMRVFEVGGEVSTATQVIFSQPLASTEPAVVTVVAGRLTLDTCRITAVDVCLRQSSVGQRATVSSSRLESTDGTCVEVDGANAWLQFIACIVRTTAIGATGQAFFVGAAGANVHVIDCEVASGSAQPCMLVTNCQQIVVRGGEWQCGVAAGSVGISVGGNIDECLSVDGVSVMVCAIWVTRTAGVQGFASIRNCCGSVTVTTCVNWSNANIPTRGLFEIGNSWNAAAANVFLLHAQNDANVARRSNNSSAGEMSETAITP